MLAAISQARLIIYFMTRQLILSRAKYVSRRRRISAIIFILSNHWPASAPHTKSTSRVIIWRDTIIIAMERRSATQIVVKKQYLLTTTFLIISRRHWRLLSQLNDLIAHDVRIEMSWCELSADALNIGRGHGNDICLMVSIRCRAHTMTLPQCLGPNEDDYDWWPL